MVEFEALNALISVWTGVGVFVLFSLLVLVPLVFLICWFKLKDMDEKDIKKQKKQLRDEIVDVVKEIHKADSVSEYEDKK